MAVQSLFNLIALVVTLAAVFGWINHRWLRLPHTIGLVLIALVVSVSLLVVDAVAPGMGIESAVREVLTEIEFEDTLMRGMLSFLLFAGALHVDLNQLLERKWVILTMATVGIVVSTVLVAMGSYFALRVAGIDVPLAYCFVFGALISPTDPIAVLGILKSANVPDSLQAKIAGESLFNDGVGIVLFTILVEVATGDTRLTAGQVGVLFLEEAVGGVVLGLMAGWITYRAMRAIDEHNLEVLMTLSLVMGTYAIASIVHFSGPIAVVVAGLFIGNHGKRFAMSPSTRDHIGKFWSLLDEVLNSLLFLAIGFEVVALTFSVEILGIIAGAIPIVLVARLVSVAIPMKVFGYWVEFTRGATWVLTWGGLRGGISVALALSLPVLVVSDYLLAATYGVVVFSIVVQGLTVNKVVATISGETAG